jgi:hypothetical protein
LAFANTFTANQTLAANLVFSGSSRVIQGDFTNATNSLRTAFQSSTANGITVVTAKPNGTATSSYFITHNASDVDNSSHMYVGVTASQAQLRSDKTGTGSFVPLGIYVGGAERAVVDTSGNITPSVDNAQTLGSASKRWSDVQTASISAGSYNGGQLAGSRNKIINGAMEISQRGLSFINPADGSYTLDRWAISKSTSAQFNVGLANGSATSALPENLRLTVTTGDASVAATDVVAIEQRIEGFNIRDVTGRTFTLSFWVKSPKTGTHCVSFKNKASDRSYVATYTVNSFNTWEYKTITVTGGLITAGTWDYGNLIGVAVCFTLMVGSNYQTTAGAWQVGNFFGTAAQVNCIDQAGNQFELTGVQLEVGSVATPFERRFYGDELALCQRYHHKTFHRVFVPIASATSTGMAYYPSSMRTSPTGLWYVSYMANVASFTIDILNQTSASTVISSTAAGPAEWYGELAFNAEL